MRWCGNWLFFTFLLVVTALLYGHTLHVPWYLDDTAAIRDNLLLRDLWAALGQLFGRRGVLNLTFAVNYHLAGLSLPLLHLTNIAIHAATAGIVCLILRRLFPANPTAAMLGALLFLAHPLQTQAVTYLVQRGASLGGFFFLLAFYLYLRSREAAGKYAGHLARISSVRYAGAVLSGALAVMTKENTATLPLVLLIFERLFPQDREKGWRQAIGDVLPFCVVPFGLAVINLVQGAAGELSLHADLATLTYNAPVNYLSAQFQVVWIYLRLVLFPYGQMLEHNYPVPADPFMLPSMLGLAGIVLTVWGLWRIRQQRPLVAFGGAWFLLTLLVESSVIPLDPLFEHRLYLPMFGLVLAALDGIPALAGRRAAAVIGIVAILCYAPLTWQRNQLWNDPVRFYEDNLTKAPESERVLVGLARLYLERGRQAEARQLLERTLQVNPEDNAAIKSLAMLSLSQGNTEQAMILLGEAIRRKPLDPDRYEAAALIRTLLRQPQAALDCLQQGVAAVPQSAALYNNLGVVFAELGRWPEAEQAYRQSLELKHNSKVHDNLGESLVRQGRMAEAKEHFRAAAEGAPGNARFLLNAGVAAYRSGDEKTFAWAAAKLKRIDPAIWQELVSQTGNR